jgi:hypothetical protein
MWSALANATSGKARTIGSTAAFVAAGSGLMLGMAAPASAGVIANDSSEFYRQPLPQPLRQPPVPLTWSSPATR